MGTKAPEIAVVIPTRGRELRLAFVLESLVDQLPHDRYEVIVVRDEDAPRPFAEPPDGLAVRYLTRPGTSGPTAKRNVGWRATRAPIVAFTDDDCRASPQWLEELLAAAGSDSFLQGPTLPDPTEAQLLHGLARSVHVSAATGWFETCNMAYPRSLLERLGGFDESFGFGGEDTDLGWRAVEAGATPVFVEPAVVWHAVHSRSFPRALREASRWNDLPAVVARHPGLHESLYRRHFWTPEHMAVVIALCGLAFVPRSRALALLAVAPYVAAKVNWREPHPRRIARALAALPVHAVVDVVEFAARVPAAIRHRVLVL